MTIVVLIAGILTFITVMYWLSKTWLNNTTGENSAYETKKTFQISWEKHFLAYELIFPVLIFLFVSLFFPWFTLVLIMLILAIYLRPKSALNIRKQYWIKATKGIALTLDPTDKSITINEITFRKEDIDLIESHFSTAGKGYYAYSKIILKNGQTFLLNSSLIPLAFQDYTHGVKKELIAHKVAIP